MRFVLDASALLALLQGEPGSEQVDLVLPSAVLSSVNLTEVVTKLIVRGVDAGEVAEIIRDLELIVHAHDYDLAVDAGTLHAETKAFGLSLGDRACLALARQLGAVALTTDRAWGQIDVGVTVEVIR